MVKEPAAFIIRERGNDRIFLMNEGDTNRRVLTLFLIGTAVYGLTLILCLMIGKPALTAAISTAGAIVYIAFALYLLWLRRSGFNLSESARPTRRRSEAENARPLEEAIRQEKPLKIYVDLPKKQIQNDDEGGSVSEKTPDFGAPPHLAAPQTDEIALEETILFKTHAHWMKFFRSSFSVLLVGIACLAFGIYGSTGSKPLLPSEFRPVIGVAIFACAAIALILWIDCANDEFRIENDRVAEVYRKPFGFERERTALLNKIQTVEIARKNLFAFLFNYGDVAINIGESVLHFEYVPDPRGFRERIFAQIAACETLDRERANRAQRQFIEEIVTAIRLEK